MNKKKKGAALLLWVGAQATLEQPAARSLPLARLNEPLHCVLRPVQSNYFLTPATPVGGPYSLFTLWKLS